MSNRALLARPGRRRRGLSAAAGRARVLGHAAQQHRARCAGCDRAGRAHGRRRPDLVRPGGVLRLRRFHHGRAHHPLRLVAVGDAAGGAGHHRRRRAGAGAAHHAPLGPLPAARHHRLGLEPLLPVRRAGAVPPPRRHHRDPALQLRRLRPLRQPRHLLRHLGLRHPGVASPPTICSTPAPAAPFARCAAAALPPSPSGSAPSA